MWALAVVMILLVIDCPPTLGAVIAIGGDTLIRHVAAFATVNAVMRPLLRPSLPLWPSLSLLVVLAQSLWPSLLSALSRSL